MEQFIEEQVARFNQKFPPKPEQVSPAPVETPVKKPEQVEQPIPIAPPAPMRTKSKIIELKCTPQDDHSPPSKTEVKERSPSPPPAPPPSPEPTRSSPAPPANPVPTPAPPAPPANPVPTPTVAMPPSKPDALSMWAQALGRSSGGFSWQ